MQSQLFVAVAAGLQLQADAAIAKQGCHLNGHLVAEADLLVSADGLLLAKPAQLQGAAGDALGFHAKFGFQEIERQPQTPWIAGLKAPAHRKWPAID